MQPPTFYAACFTGIAIYNCRLPAGHPLKNTRNQSGEHVVTYLISPTSDGENGTTDI